MKDFKMIIKNLQRGFKKTPEWFDKYELEKIKGNFIDAGYYKGAFSKEYRKRNEGTIFAFEPNINTIKEEKDTKNIILIPFGTSNTIETKIIYGNTKNSPLTTADKRFKRTAEKKYSVKMECIGKATFIPIDLMKESYGKIGLIKIDTEGMEYETIEGAVKTIKQNKPLIIFETHDKDELRKCSGLLEKIGYKINQISPVDYEAKYRGGK